MDDVGECYKRCNTKYTSAIDPMRTYCKKGCGSDLDEFEKCREETCTKVCVKNEIGSDEEKWGSWSKFFSRAPADSKDCLKACEFGCANK